MGLRQGAERAGRERGTDTEERSYLTRNPWYVATGAPSNANASMGSFDLRYTLPSSAPTLGKY